MGYELTRGFQGWMVIPGARSMHGNELTSRELSRFLRDTYRRSYPGAETLWRIMQAMRTGRRKIDRYIPTSVYLGGKTGTYDGPNAAPATVPLSTIRARNHATALTVGERVYGLSILSNTGHNKDVAVLAGGLVREYLKLDGGLPGGTRCGAGG